MAQYTQAEIERLQKKAETIAMLTSAMIGNLQAINQLATLLAEELAGDVAAMQAVNTPGMREHIFETMGQEDGDVIAGP